MNTALAIWLLASGAPVPQHEYGYINYAPDRSYTASEKEQSIGMAILMDKQVFGLGHIFDVLKPCAVSLDDCVVFNGMAIKRLPPEAAVGKTYKEGRFEFKLTSNSALDLLGRTFHVIRVDVFNDGMTSNAYLFDRDRGVIAIIMKHAENKEIPESIFFLRADKGLYASSEVGKNNGKD